MTKLEIEIDPHGNYANITNNGRTIFSVVRSVNTFQTKRNGYNMESGFPTIYAGIESIIRYIRNDELRWKRSVEK